MRKVLLTAALLLLVAAIAAPVMAQEDAAREKARYNYELAARAMERGDYARAIFLYKENQELDPTYWDYVRHEAVAYWDWGRVIEQRSGKQAAQSYYQSALSAFDRTLELAIETSLQPQYVMSLLHQRSAVAADMGNYNEAIRTMETALRMNPNDIQSNYLMGVLLRDAYTEVPTASSSLVTLSQTYFKRAIEANESQNLVIPYAYFFVGTELYNNMSNDAEAERLLTVFIVQMALKREELTAEDLEHMELAQAMLRNLQ